MTLFDPPPEPPGRPQRKVWSVGRLVAAVRDDLERKFPVVWVRGEVTGFRAPGSGHWYFTLKDDRAVLAVAMFRSDNLGVPFVPEEGLDVVVGGRLTIYDRQGAFQLIAELLEPVGWGAQQLAFEQLRQRLGAEGLFDEERKRPLPLMPSTVGVVTSPSGAAWSDIVRAWRRRQVGFRAVLSPTRVQGDGAGAEIAAALRRLQRHVAPDVILLSRGGGAPEELWAFNEESVVRAIAASTAPVIVGVGHEIDTTLADLVADVRAATPTAAAEIVAPAREDLEQRLEVVLRRARGGTDRLAQARLVRLRRPELQRALRQPAFALRRYQQRLDDASRRLQGAADRNLRRRRERLHAARVRTERSAPRMLAARRRARSQTALDGARAALREAVRGRRERLLTVAARVEAMSPLAVLGRGYALCHAAADGTLVRRHDQVDEGDRVRVRLAAGSLDCEVLEGRPPEEAGPE